VDVLGFVGQKVRLTNLFKSGNHHHVENVVRNGVRGNIGLGLDRVGYRANGSYDGDDFCGPQYLV
jgi:hypothetical protein